MWENDKEPRDPGMPEGDEGDVGKWTPSSSQVNNENGEQHVEPQDDIAGLEAALIDKEREQQELEITNKVKRLMETNQMKELLSSVEIGDISKLPGSESEGSWEEYDESEGSHEE